MSSTISFCLAAVFPSLKCFTESYEERAFRPLRARILGINRDPAFVVVSANARDLRDDVGRIRLHRSALT